MLTELITGLSAANQATQIVKELREIDRLVDEASFKLKLAELTEALAETKIALSEAKLALVEKDEEISQLKRTIEVNQNGERCPKCKDGTMQVIQTAPYPIGIAARSGVQNWTQRCDNETCGHEDTIIHDPNGIMNSRK